MELALLMKPTGLLPALQGRRLHGIAGAAGLPPRAPASRLGCYDERKIMDARAYLDGLALWLNLIDRCLATFDRVAWPPGVEEGISRGDSTTLQKTKAAIFDFLPKLASEWTKTPTPPRDVEASLADRACRIAACYEARLALLGGVARAEVKRHESLGRTFVLQVREWRIETSKQLRDEMGLVQFQYQVAAAARLAKRPGSHPAPCVTPASTPTVIDPLPRDGPDPVGGFLRWNGKVTKGQPLDLKLLKAIWSGERIEQIAAAEIVAGHDERPDLRSASHRATKLLHRVGAPLRVTSRNGFIWLEKC